MTDSLCLTLPHLVAFCVPGPIWGAATALLIAFVSSWLARRSTRSGPWWQAQVDAYTNVVEQFLIIADNIGKLADYDAGDEETDPDPHKYKSADVEGCEDKARAGHEEIRRQIKRGSFLLSPRAVGLLRQYVSEVKNIDLEPGHHFDYEWKFISARYHQDFYELARVDLGTDWSWPWRIRRGWRRLKNWRQRRRGGYAR